MLRPTIFATAGPALPARQTLAAVPCVQPRAAGPSPSRPQAEFQAQASKSGVPLTQSGGHSSSAKPAGLSRLATTAAAAGAAALLLTSPPAFADVQSAPTAEQVVAAAKPLQAQSVDKGRVWLLFALGASVLYGSAVLLENNEAWFPAISRANKALRAGLKAAEDKARAAEEEEELAQRRLGEVRQERQRDARAESAVLAGLQSAKAKALPSEASPPGDQVVAAGAEHEPGSAVDGPHQAGAAAGDAARGGGAPAAAEPLFEISGEQIAASAAQAQGRLLQEASLEQLERELQVRRAAASPSSGSNGSE